METSLRLALLGIGCIVLIGLCWDLFRGRVKKKNAAYSKHAFKKTTKTMVMPEVASYAHTESDLSNFEEVVLLKSSKPAETADATQGVANTPMDDIIALSIMARQPGVFLGKKLQDVFSEAQLELGEMDIFHRYDTREDREPIFSVASAVEPGTFDFKRMDTMVTPGLMLFFSLTTPNQSIAAFELMLRIARQLAQRLDGELRDDRRRLLSAQSIENYREKVRMVGLRRHAT
jgi:cell division protein ZipA